MTNRLHLESISNYEISCLNAKDCHYKMKCVFSNFAREYFETVGDLDFHVPPLDAEFYDGDVDICCLQEDRW